MTLTEAVFAFALLCLVMYVVLDGYDLGIGIATLLERDRQHRREMMIEQVGHAWDGNESWIVLLGTALNAGFPLAFGTILPYAYLPLIIMLLALIARGVSVEMASQSAFDVRWERALGIGSLFAALAQGVVLGTLTQKLTVVNGAFSGSPFGAIGWFSVLTGVGVTCVYLALGYAYLKMKATGGLRAKVGRRGVVSVLLASVLVVASFVALPATAAPLNLNDTAHVIGFGALLLLAAGAVAITVVTLRPASRYDSLPYAALVISAAALIIALVVARYPVLVPPTLTVYNTVAPKTTMEFLVVAFGVQLPLLLFYTWFAHRAFRGRVRTA
jgi:cytochrome d ubiquinol oxidase subunit II